MAKDRHSPITSDGTSDSRAGEGGDTVPTGAVSPDYLCSICDDRCGDDDGREWVVDLIGTASHVACLEEAGIWDRQPRRDDA